MRQHTLIAVLLAALVYALALPNELFAFGNPVLGLIALVPLYVALGSLDSPRDAARYGALFGAVSTALSNYWLMFFEDYSVWTIGGTTLGYTAYNYLLAGFLWYVLRHRRELGPVLFALAWTLYEYLKSVGFLGYPWGLAAYPFNTIPSLIQIADVTGVWGLSFLVVLVNASIGQLVIDRRPDRWLAAANRRPDPRNALFALVLFAATVGYGASRIVTEFPVKTHINLLLVQQNADSWNTRDVAGPLQTAQEATTEALASSSESPDLIVWSETALRYLYQPSSSWYAANPPALPFLDFVRSLPAPLLTGAPYVDGDRDEFYNAAILIAPDTSMTGWYGKRQLVPFAESIPFWEVAVVRNLFERVVGISGIWTPGPDVTLFTVTTEDGTPVVIGTPICFEDAFARVTADFVLAGADVIVNLTNNAWSRTNSAQIQHLVAARFRAVETRRTMVRSTNSGLTGHIDPWGRIVESLPMFETGTLSLRVPVYAPVSESVYLTYGDYFPFLALLLLVGSLPSHPLGRARPARRRPGR